MSNSMTYAQALDLARVTVPDHLEAEMEVPVLTDPQRQGDLLIEPVTMIPGQAVGWARGKRTTRPRSRVAVTDQGVQVVHGEATGNTHWLHNNFGSAVEWVLATPDEAPVRGWIVVPEGQSALLIHTDEHGANAIGAGTYAIRQRRQVESSGQLGYISD